MNDDLLDPLGPYDPEIGQAIRWCLGPLTLELGRRLGEWRVGRRRGGDLTASDWSCEGLGEPALTVDPAERDPALTKVKLARFACPHQSDGPLTAKLNPMLADRPVVVRLEDPLTVLPGAAASIYVTTPLWCGIYVGNVSLFELPTFRPSDTWFGPNFREGALCYAGRTAARLSVEALLGLPYRAATEITVNNRFTEPLRLERLSLPMDHLALFKDTAAELWTESLQADWLGAAEPIPIKILAGAPAQAPEGVLVGPRRVAASEQILFRMISRLRRSPGG